MESWTLPLVSALALGAVMWTMYRERRQTSSFKTSRPLPPIPAPRKPKAKVITPAPVGIQRARGDTGDLDSVLSSVVDTAPPVVPLPMRDSVPYTDEEVRQIVSNVLARINDNGAWDLRLVALDGVSKTVDSYKTLLYELTFAAYSPPRNIGIKMATTVIVPPTNVMYIQTLKTFNAPVTDDPVRGSRGPQTEEEHAEWVPVL
jgi:hypothetical protein